jgi:hypothetical protein
MQKLLSLLMPRLLLSAFKKNIELRKGLPLRMSERLGSFASLEESYDEKKDNCKEPSELSDSSNPNPNPETNANSESSVFQLTLWRDQLKGHVKALVSTLAAEVSLCLLDEAADEITGDFVQHRLGLRLRLGLGLRLRLRLSLRLWFDIRTIILDSK